MTWFTLAALLTCITAISSGQILFKYAAKAWNEAGTLFDPTTLMWLGSVVVVYGITTLGWAWVLTKVPLSKAYPFMALGFILVPLASKYLFNETLNSTYTVGTVLIVAGVILVTK